MTSSGVSLLKFVGTVSLGLLTGASYTVSAFAFPTFLHFPSSADASRALVDFNSRLRIPIIALTSLASAPLLLSFVLSPRNSRHPYLLYTSLLTLLSFAAPNLVARRVPAPAEPAKKKKKTASRPVRNLEASYEVLGDVPSEEAHSEEDSDEFAAVNGEDVKAEVEWVVKRYFLRTGFAALGFAMAVVGIWGDGAPQTVSYLS
ncbi:unnamed protein product [Clonostachys rosea f. rosea IK726]|uniref:Uncharacterized protein n=1 Tax=Clonostachys rosea f. rosea IK726 TaxID=1349383 RepID=A0ACA9TB02_BIOOC|nr:unnamed protein product [Clonostachys rosea f. rosea IK726]